MKFPGILFVARKVVFASTFLFAAGSLAANGGPPPQKILGDSMPASPGAPLMKFKILNQSAQETTYAVIFGVGDEVLSGLTQFAEENHIAAARITGVGAVRGATLGWFDPQRKTYRRIAIDHQSEVLSLLGDIAMHQGKPVVHAHMVVGFPSGKVAGGHLLEAYVRPTLEVIVTAYPRAMYKKFDREKGLAVIDPSIQN